MLKQVGEWAFAGDIVLADKAQEGELRCTGGVIPVVSKIGIATTRAHHGKSAILELLELIFLKYLQHEGHLGGLPISAHLNAYAAHPPTFESLEKPRGSKAPPASET